MVRSVALLVTDGVLVNHAGEHVEPDPKPLGRLSVSLYPQF
jgi:hypothetical protein